MYKLNLFLLICFLFFNLNQAFAKTNLTHYTKETISNYFLGSIFSIKKDSEQAFNYLNKSKSLSKTHNQYNQNYIMTMVEIGKFKETFHFLKNINDDHLNFFEGYLLKGIDALINKKYESSSYYFKKLENQSFDYSDIYKKTIVNILLSWNSAAQGDYKSSFNFSKEISYNSKNLMLIQNSLLHCYRDSSEVITSYEKLVFQKEYDFLRYGYFLANYLISKNKNKEAGQLIKKIATEGQTNLLIDRSNYLIQKKKFNEFKNEFDCKKIRHTLAEIFYVISTLFSSQKNFEKSNFYLKLSIYLNDKFNQNRALLAENYLDLEKLKLSKKEFESLKELDPVYFWYSSKQIANILTTLKDKKNGVKYIEKAFHKLKKPDFKKYFDMANFYKDYKFYHKSVVYYSKTLETIPEHSNLLPKIYDRRGTSYERLDLWNKAEKDLEMSLLIQPDQPYVINYLAYSWLERNKNINESLQMLKKANNLKQNDPYIIDSLGWAMFLNKDYINAEKLLRQAVQLIPNDPIINDHYADILWKLNRKMQAQYIWKQVLNLKNTKPELKEAINKKLLFGV